jgi:hypothetical protein
MEKMPCRVMLSEMTSARTASPSSPAPSPPCCRFFFEVRGVVPTVAYAHRNETQPRQVCAGVG